MEFSDLSVNSCHRASLSSEGNGKQRIPQLCAVQSCRADHCLDMLSQCFGMSVVANFAVKGTTWNNDYIQYYTILYHTIL